MENGHVDLRGLKVLVVEDEALIAFDLENLLRAQGCEVIGAASSNGDCLEVLARQRPDVVVLDAQLLDGLAYPAAGALRAVGIPFVMVSGLDDVQLDGPIFGGMPRVAKPYRSTTVVAAIGQLVFASASDIPRSAA
jgi:DNA-binding response OmpR family regulator